MHANVRMVVQFLPPIALHSFKIIQWEYFSVLWLSLLFSGFQTTYDASDFSTEEAIDIEISRCIFSGY